MWGPPCALSRKGPVDRFCGPCLTPAVAPEAQGSPAWERGMDGTSTPCPRSMLPHTWCGAHLVFLSRDWDRSPMCCHCAGLVFGWKPSKELEKHGLCPAHRKRLRVSQARLPSSTESDLNNGHHHQSKSAGAISSMGRKGTKEPSGSSNQPGVGSRPGARTLHWCPLCAFTATPQGTNLCSQEPDSFCYLLPSGLPGPHVGNA